MFWFPGIEPCYDLIPDWTIPVDFRHLLERHGMNETILVDVNAYLPDNGIKLRSGTLVEVSPQTSWVHVRPPKIIDAPSSTKNQARAQGR